jgi:hypothetical protein
MQYRDYDKTVIYFCILLLLFLVLFLVKKITIGILSKNWFIRLMKSKTIHQKNIFWVFVVIWFSRINTTFFILAFDVDLPYLTMIATFLFIF